MNEHLKTSQAGLDLIAKWEGIILHPYICPAGKKTIGIGHVILPNENFGPTITKEQAFQILAKDVAICENAIKRDIKVKLTQHQFDALVSWTFNCGTGVLKTSSLAKELNNGNYDCVPSKLLEWCKFKVNGVLKVNQGLYNRRKSEGEMWLRPDENPSEPVSDDTDLNQEIAMGDHKMTEKLYCSEDDLYCHGPDEILVCQ